MRCTHCDHVNPKVQVCSNCGAEPPVRHDDDGLDIDPESE